MSTNPTDITSAALSLPYPERLELIRQLVRSLTPPRSETAEVDLLEEVESRLAAYDRGEVDAIDWEGALTQLRQSLAPRQGP